MSRPRIGLSACIFHPDPERPIFKGKSLLYAEESMFGWVAEHGGLPLCLPRPILGLGNDCLLYTSPSPRDQRGSRMPSSA